MQILCVAIYISLATETLKSGLATMSDNFMHIILIYTETTRLKFHSTTELLIFVYGF